MKHTYNDLQKEYVIAAALETEEGRVALAQAMVEPIKRSLEYQAIGRKLLMVDELPQGQYARYEKDVASVAYVISRRGAVPDRITEGDEILVPTFEIGANPQIRLSEIKARRLTTKNVKVTLNLAKCWKPLRAFDTYSNMVKVYYNSNSSKDWAISRKD